MDNTIAGSTNDNINMDNTIVGSKNAHDIAEKIVELALSNNHSLTQELQYVIFVNQQILPS
jgi:hypothetical protein